MARQRQAAAVRIYNDILSEVRQSYEAGCRILDGLSDLRCVEEGPGHADGPGDIQLVRVVEDFCLDGGRRVLGAEAVGPDTVPDMGGEALRKTVVQQEAIRLFRPHPGVAEAGVLELLRPADVVEQASRASISRRNEK